MVNKTVRIVLYLIGSRIDYSYCLFFLDHKSIGGNERHLTWFYFSAFFEDIILLRVGFLCVKTLGKNIAIISSEVLQINGDFFI